MTAANDAHLEEIAKTAAREAVHETLLMLGIDASSPGAIERAQRDFLFLRDLRSGTDAVKRKTLLWFVGVLLTTVAAYIALGFKH
jgi:hypothetical protein